MNIYKKYCPNVYVAQCTETHEKGEVIQVTTMRGKDNDCIVHNLVAKANGYNYYSITRADGYDQQERAKSKSEKLQAYADNAQKKSAEQWEASNEGREFLALGEPIKVGHHSERRHRALIERNHNRMHKAVELERKAEEYERRSEYWAEKAETINLSMPESLEYYEFELEKAKVKHEALISGKEKREHNYSLAYAKKTVNEIQKKLDIARKLWA